MKTDLPQDSHLGEEEGLDLFEKRLNEDDLLEEIRAWKANLKRKGFNDNLTEKIVKALHVAEEELSSLAPKKGESKHKKKKFKEVVEMDKGNIMNEKRNEGIDQKQWTKNSMVKDLDLKIGSEVRIATHRFGREYARGLPKFTIGKVLELVGGSARVKWRQGDENVVSNLSLKIDHKRGITLATSACELPVWNDPRKGNPEEKINISIDEILELERGLVDMPKVWNANTILPIMEVGSCISGSEMGGSWPKDFYEALIRPDWRRWIEAVKDENESWQAFEACKEIPYDLIQSGASVIPLGELFTIKRNGKYKFRQIALGNLLKEGKDYAETFASTISGDGIRWFYSIASTCGKNIYGLEEYIRLKAQYKNTVSVPWRGFRPSSFLLKFVMMLKEKRWK